ncbi:conserved hypothetical protein [Verticillium alfalfae VaMs.102]|uniref:Mitochondrial carrier protein PET8 n=1 Tax=Verticillium alfalfae (strain VaMs.102 / ATCC MYA-4576 / FGSC 10136) TaxID=526221 RepID=C9SFB6_VERA1|nr:conserved hypothetical protein [Verticillium alfalfae VaMs.102]EEY17902.1 conserved hypothetical protein [Verticillium alfalfae VaMs.102]
MISRIALSARPRASRPEDCRRPQLQLSTTARAGLKESAGQDADYKKHQDDSLRKQKEGKGHWKPELASDSEEAINADRNADLTPEQLQEKTKKAAEETRKAGTSMRDGL